MLLKCTVGTMLKGERDAEKKMARLIHGERSATALRIRKACRNIPPVMKDAPDVDMIVSLDVEDQIGVGSG